MRRHEVQHTTITELLNVVCVAEPFEAVLLTGSRAERWERVWRR